MKNKFIKTQDLIIIILILLSSVSIYFIVNKFVLVNAVEAEILYNNKILENVSLNENRIFSPEGFPNIELEIKNNSIAFIHSDCPDKVCVNTGFINKAGQTAVCLPNKMVIRLKADNSDTDTVM